MYARERVPLAGTAEGATAPESLRQKDRATGKDALESASPVLGQGRATEGVTRHSLGDGGESSQVQ